MGSKKLALSGLASFAAGYLLAARARGRKAGLKAGLATALVGILAVVVLAGGGDPEDLEAIEDAAEDVQVEPAD